MKKIIHSSLLLLFFAGFRNTGCTQLLENYIVGNIPTAVFIEGNDLYYAQRISVGMDDTVKIIKQNIGPGFPVNTTVYSSASESWEIITDITIKEGTTLYYGLIDDHLSSSALVKRFQLSNPVVTHETFSSPTDYGGLVKIACHANTVYCVATEGESTYYKYGTMAMPPVIPTLASSPGGIMAIHIEGDMLYLGGSAGQIYAKDLTTASPLSLIYTSPGETGIHSITYFEGKIYFSDEHGIHRFNPLLPSPVTETIDNGSAVENGVYSMAIKTNYLGEKYLYAVDWATKILRMNLNDICTNPEIPALSLSAPACEGSPITLTIDGERNGADEWYVYEGACGGTLIGTTASSSIEIIQDAASVTYYVRGEGGCIASPESCSSITVDLAPTENAEFFYTGINYCVNASDPSPIITGLSGGTFTNEPMGLVLDASTGIIDLSESEAGSYEVMYTTSGTCSGVHEFDITIADIDASVSYDGFTLIANATEADYQWIDCENNNVFIDGATDQTYSPTLMGTYAVIVSNGECTDTSECVSMASLNIQQGESDQIMKLYPNPTNGHFTIDLGASYRNISVRIIDLLGKTVAIQDFENTSSTTVFFSAQDGFYSVEVTLDNGMIIRNKIQKVNK